MAKILIIGCGDIGSGLAQRLSGQGHRVIGVKRHPAIAQQGAIQFVQADIVSDRSLSALPLDCDFIYFMATPDRRDLNSYKAIYVEGLERVLQRFADVRRRPHVFFISSTGVYGQCRGEWVDETSVTKPERPTAALIASAEQRVWGHRQDNTVIRFSGIYGRKNHRLLAKLDSKTPVQYHPPYYSNRIHRDDCIAVLAFLFDKLLNGERLDNCYLASDDRPAPIWEVMSWMAQYCHKNEPRRLDHEGTGQNKRCSNRRLKQLGYRFIYPGYQEGYARAFDAEH